MKRIRIFKCLSVLVATILLLLMAQAAASAVGEIEYGMRAHAIASALQQFFDGWRGSKTLAVLAAICFVLAIAGRGIERR